MGARRTPARSTTDAQRDAAAVAGATAFASKQQPAARGDATIPTVAEERWADEAFRLRIGTLANRLLADDVCEAATGLWRLGFTTGEFGFAGALWQIWGRITDEFTHPDGDSDEGVRWALEAAADLLRALGDEQLERRHCDYWIYERLDIIL